MAERSPRHRLTASYRDGKLAGWVKTINKRQRWICSVAVAPTGADADAYYAKHFSDLWAQPAVKPVIPDDPRLISVAVLCDAFIDAKRRKRDEGRLDGRTVDGYRQILQRLCDAVGADTPAGTLGPVEFAKFDAVVNKRAGLIRRRLLTRVVRMLFRWAAKPPVSLPLPDYGDTLTGPTKAEIRRGRKRDREERGLLLFTPEEIRAQLAAANPALKAMILLAVNAGMGNADLGSMPQSVIDLDTGWMEYARQKTGVERRAWLWPETVAAVREYLKVRPRPLPGFERLLFVTRGGQAYVRHHFDADGEWRERRDKIVEGYRKLLGRLGQFRAGRSFYSLRRSHRTYSDELADQRAAAKIMGHAVEDLGSVYVQVISDERIKALCAHVRRRVLNVS